MSPRRLLALAGLVTLLSLGLAASSVHRAQEAGAVFHPSPSCSSLGPSHNGSCRPDNAPRRCDLYGRCGDVGGGLLGRSPWAGVFAEALGRIQGRHPVLLAGPAGHAGNAGPVGPSTTAPRPERCDVDGLVVTCRGPAGTKTMVAPEEAALDAICADLPCRRPSSIPVPSAPALVSGAVILVAGFVAAFVIRRAQRPA